MIAVACSVVFGLILLAALETAAWCWLVGRYKRRRSYTDLVLSQPPVPLWKAVIRDTPAFRGDDRQPHVFDADTTLEELETAAYRAEFAAIVCEQFPYDAKRFQS